MEITSAQLIAIAEIVTAYAVPFRSITIHSSTGVATCKGDNATACIEQNGRISYRKGF